MGKMIFQKDHHLVKPINNLDWFPIDPDGGVLAIALTTTAEFNGLFMDEKCEAEAEYLLSNGKAIRMYALPTVSPENEFFFQDFQYYAKGIQLFWHSANSLIASEPIKSGKVIIDADEAMSTGYVRYQVEYTNKRIIHGKLGYLYILVAISKYFPSLVRFNESEAMLIKGAKVCW